MVELFAQKMTLGRFAKLHNVNKRTLIYYDNIGFFSPREVGDNGYRYYSFEQNFTFLIIQILRRMQFSLKDIKLYLQLYEHEHLLAYLHNKSQLLENQLAEVLTLYLESKQKQDPNLVPAALGKHQQEQKLTTFTDPQPAMSRFLEECSLYRSKLRQLPSGKLENNLN